MFLTGGTGVVGTAILRRLLDDGRSVRALTRSAGAAAAAERLGAEAVRGDVLDAGSLAPAMDGCDVVYHAAGMNKFCLPDPSPMFAVNVQGSATVVEAAVRAGVRRVVYTSSAVTLGEETGTVGREDSPHRGSFLSAYERSKYEAEQAVLARAGEVEIVCVNPSSVQGPGRSSGTGQVLVQFLRGRLKFWVATTVSLVDIDDCADGHVRAELKGQPGRRYVLNAGSLDSAELLSVMARLAPAIKPPRVVPAAPLTGLVSVMTAVARLRRRTPVVCRESMRALMHGHRYDGSRAERELGVTYRPIEETLHRTAEWLVHEELVPAAALDGPS